MSCHYVFYVELSSQLCTFHLVPSTPAGKLSNPSRANLKNCKFLNKKEGQLFTYFTKRKREKHFFFNWLVFPAFFFAQNYLPSSYFYFSVIPSFFQRKKNSILLSLYSPLSFFSQTPVSPAVFRFLKTAITKVSFYKMTTRIFFIYLVVVIIFGCYLT